MQHLDEGTIHAWLDGALAPPEAEQAAKHAAACATCAAAVAEARGTIAGSARIVSALDDVPGGVIPGRATSPATSTSMWRRLRLTPGRAALAATILIAVSATLTLRSSPLPSPADTAVTLIRREPLTPAAGAPVVGSVAVDSIKTPGPSANLVSASAQQKRGVAAPVAQPRTVAERREVADAIAPRDTVARELAKARAATQEPAAGASVAATAAATAAAAPPMARSNFGSAKALEQRVAVSGDSTNTFEGCYRLSADSSSGSTEIPRGLPASFTLSRPSAELRSPSAQVARRAADVRVDSNTQVLTAWRQLSPSQANVTFVANGTRQVLLVLTAGSPVGVASSGDRTTTVRVARSTCPP